MSHSSSKSKVQKNRKKKSSRRKTNEKDTKIEVVKIEIPVADPPEITEIILDTPDAQVSPRELNKNSKRNNSSPRAEYILEPAQKDQLKIPRASDPTERRILNVEDLDLDRVYDSEAEKIVERPAKPKIFWDIGSEPLTDPSKLPKDWSPDELDLDPNDISSQIERCEERLKANIMPQVFENRLGKWEAQKSRREEKLYEYPGISWHAIQRLESLKRIKALLLKDGDKFEQMPNVTALVNAYESQNLIWRNGLVTYWSRGVQLSQPRPFDWDEFEAINKKHDGGKAFWVEGLHGPTPALNMLAMGFPPIGLQEHNLIQLALRIPGVQWSEQMDFLYDTGATTMTIYEGDIKDLMITNLQPSRLPILGMWEFRTSDGRIAASPTIELEVTCLNAQGLRLIPSRRVISTVLPGEYDVNGAPRTDGPVMRQNMYSATAPDRQRCLYFLNHLQDFGVLPAVENPTPPFHVPQFYLPNLPFQAAFTQAPPTDYLTPLMPREPEAYHFQGPPGNPATMPQVQWPMSEEEIEQRIAALRAQLPQNRRRDRLRSRIENLRRSITSRPPPE